MDWIRRAATAVFGWLRRYPLAVIGSAAFLIAGAAMLLLGKRLDVGGVIGRLFGVDRGPDPRTLPPEGRTDESGKPIPVGQSDPGGFVQAPAEPGVKDPGILDDGKSITVQMPDGTKDKVDLPKGVGNKDVKDVTEVRPEVREVGNNDKGVDSGGLLDVLKGGK